MAINSEVWSSSTKKIFTGVLIGLGVAVLNVIISFVAPGISQIGSLVCGLASAFAIFMQMQGANAMKTAVEDGDMSAVGNIEGAFKMMLFATCIGLLMSFLMLVLPTETLVSNWLLSIIITVVLAILAAVFGIIGAIKGLKAFSVLKNSETFPAKDGASKLYIAYLLYVIGYGCAITVILAAVGGIASLVAYVFAFIGWKNLSETKA